MGVPYSQEIRTAVDQIAPLVAAVQITKNILILLAAVQVSKVVLSALTLLATLALPITVNPGPEDERAAAVTPVMKWIIHRLSSFFPAMHSQKDLERRKADRIQEESPVGLSSQKILQALPALIITKHWSISVPRIRV